VQLLPDNTRLCNGSQPQEDPLVGPGYYYYYYYSYYSYYYFYYYYYYYYYYY
jgi:hypothetical protein